MGLELQPDLCSLLIKDVIYHEEAVRQAGAEALSRAVAQYRSQAAEVMNKLTEIYQEKLYVSPLVCRGWQPPASAVFAISYQTLSLLSVMRMCMKPAVAVFAYHRLSCLEPQVISQYWHCCTGGRCAVGGMGGLGQSRGWAVFLSPL